MNRKQVTPRASGVAVAVRWRTQKERLFIAHSSNDKCYIYSKYQVLFVAPGSIFQLLGFFLPPQLPFLHLGSGCKLFYFQHSASILCKHFSIFLIYYFKATGIARWEITLVLRSRTSISVYLFPNILTSCPLASDFSSIRFCL